MGLGGHVAWMSSGHAVAQCVGFLVLWQGESVENLGLDFYVSGLEVASMGHVGGGGGL